MGMGKCLGEHITLQEFVQDSVDCSFINLIRIFGAISYYFHNIFQSNGETLEKWRKISKYREVEMHPKNSNEHEKRMPTSCI